MKAIRIHSYGDIDTLSFEDAPLPDSGAEDVRIQVHAAAVNPVDWKIRGGYLAEMVPHQMPLTALIGGQRIERQLASDMLVLSYAKLIRRCRV